MNTGRAKAEGQFPREGERLQPEMQLPQKVEQPTNNIQAQHKYNSQRIFFLSDTEESDATGKSLFQIFASQDLCDSSKFTQFTKVPHSGFEQ